MLSQVEQEIRRKVERELNIIQGASQLKKKTDNVMVIQKCNTNIREAQQNIQYLEETLRKLQLNNGPDSQSAAQKRASLGYGQLSTIAPDELTFSRLDLMKYDCPSLSQRIQYMLQQLEFKLQVEEQYQEANEKLTKLYQIDGDRRSSSAAEGGSKESKQRIQLLKKSLKKYQAINVDLDQFKDHADGSQPAQPKFRRKQLTGTLTIGINAVRDVDHIQSPMFSRKPDTFITIKIDDTVQAKTRPSRTGRWQEEFHINVGKGNEIEFTVYDKVNEQIVPVAQMWLLLSDIAEEIRKKKAGQTGQIGWNPAARSAYQPETTLVDPSGEDSTTRHASASSADAITSQPITSSLWFVLEPAGQILLNLGFSKSSEPTNKNLMGGLHRHGAIINRKEEVYEQHGHHFVQKSFYNIMCCAYCGDFLRYTGFQCQDCKFLCHKKCYNHVVTKCIAKASTDADPEEPKLNHCIPHRFEPISNRGTKWCCHCGYILPWGKKNLRKCSECGIMCHIQCAHLVPDFCGMSMDMANQILTAIQDTQRSQKERKKLRVTATSAQTDHQGDAAKNKVNKVNKVSSFEVKPLPASPSNINFADVLGSGRNIQNGKQNLYDFEATESIQQQPTKRIAPEEARNGLLNDRLNDFIEQNTDYDAFTGGAHYSQPNEPEEAGRTLDPTNFYEIDNGTPEFTIDSTKSQMDRDAWIKQQRGEELEQKQSHQADEPSNETPDTAFMDLDTKQPQFEAIESSRNNLNNQVNAQLQPDVYNNTTQEIVDDKFDQLHLQNSTTDETAVSPVTQQSAELQPSSRSPQHSHASGKHKKKVSKRRKISLDDFVLLKVLGKGNFGKVLLAKSKNNERLCAIKVLKKDHIIKNHDIESARAEKKVFLLATKAKHPFLTNLFCSFQTENRIYFAMEFIGGGDLMWHVQNQRLSVRRAKFYAAEVLLALKYFHDNGVIYRDLKLENILLTPEGHIKIADYGLCKDEMWYGNKTSTFCGTPEFMAPEILKEQEYTKAVDWWAFGVLLYQMLLCQSPFSGDDEDEVFNAILTDEPLYPIDMAGDIVQIFQGLLTKDPERRLGAGPRDASEVMSEPFFRNINFEDILNKRIQPPYIPEIKAADDTSYFEKEFTSAPPTLTPLPSVLSSNLQEEFRGFSFMPEDLLL
ncbi:LANO_0F12618g1_1 [Lachancea nothofagi CBS 11611]|uniref:Protein kinase C-like 1 n=1 Tax=Lachancea nothofagi CBS 11611 TaxID=1266666 RepID=A0A1G4KBG3_9SACH|nr:LANO_0F12618g1_1 [Lachancea nothofagi CBS 11611]